MDIGLVESLEARNWKLRAASNQWRPLLLFASVFCCTHAHCQSVIALLAEQNASTSLKVTVKYRARTQFCWGPCPLQASVLQQHTLPSAAVVLLSMLLLPLK